MPHRSIPQTQDGTHPDARRRELDVRPLLAAGREPFTAIMAALEDLGPGDVLALRAPFNPRPLHAVMRRRGYRHAVRKHGRRDVEVLYWQDSETPSPPSLTPASAEPPEIAKVIDVRGLTPPEPMERTLPRLSSCRTVRPCSRSTSAYRRSFSPVLEERGFAYTVADDASGYKTTIWRRLT